MVTIRSKPENDYANNAGSLTVNWVCGPVVTPSGVTSFFDYFDTTAIDASKWNNYGYIDFGPAPNSPVTIDTNGIAQFPAWGALSTKGKVTFSGSKIVIEARMGGVESRFILADGPNPGESLMV